MWGLDVLQVLGPPLPQRPFNKVYVGPGYGFWGFCRGYLTDVIRMFLLGLGVEDWAWAFALGFSRVQVWVGFWVSRLVTIIAFASSITVT